MAYKKQNFTSGQVLKAEHLNNIEDGIKANEEEISKLKEDIATQGIIENGFLIIKNSQGLELFRVDLNELSGGSGSEDVDIKGSISVDVTELTVNEGGQITFGVKLDNKPTNEQIVNVSVSDSGVSVSPQELTFTSKNFSEYQTVTLTGDEDTELGNIKGNITLSSNGVASVIIAFVKTDNDNIEYYTVTIDDVTGINSTNYLMATYTGNESNILIPNTLNEKTVQMNAQTNKAFDTNSVIENISFGEDVLGVFSQSNTQLPKLKTIVGVGKLEQLGFNSSNTLETVIINSVNDVMTSFKANGTSLKNVKGLENLTNITSMEQSLKGSSSLTKIDSLPPNVKNTKLMCWNCTSLVDVPPIDMTLETWSSMFLNCNALTEVTVSAMNGCGVDLIGYNTLNGTGWNGGNFTFKCNFGSDMYHSFRDMICNSKGSSEKLFYELLDETNVTDVVMWGDSMTKAGNDTMGNMPDQLATLVKDDVMIWNYGYSGNTIASCGTRFNNHTEKWGDVSVIWLGTNNTNYTGEQMANEIQSTFIDKLTTDKYIVLGLLTTNYSEEKNQAFANAFGEHYLDIRSYFLDNMWTISGLEATEQDTNDLSNDLIPTSFRYDVTHLNPTGGLIVANGIKEKLIAMGYINE